MNRFAFGRPLVSALGSALCLLVFGVGTASATHYRYQTISWEKDLTYVSPPGQPAAYKVHVIVSGGWRWSYPFTYGSQNYCPPPPFVSSNPSTVGIGSCPPLGAVIGVGGSFIAVDKAVAFNTATTFSTASYPYNATVTTINQQLDLMYTDLEFDVTFPVTSNPITLTYSSTNRISTLLDGNNDTPWIDSIVINADPTFGTKSPVSTSLPLLYVTAGVQNDIFLPTTAFDNFVNQFRFATVAESDLVNPVPLSATGTPALTLDPTTPGLIHFTPRAGVTGPYAVQFKIASYDTSVTPNVKKNEIPLELIFQAQPVNSTTATLTTPSTAVTFPVGQTTSFQVTADLNPEAAGWTGTINSTPLPTGATFTVPTGTGSAPILATFTWTPNLQSVSGVECFQATYTKTSDGTTVTSPSTLCVNLNLGALATTLTLSPVAAGSVGDLPTVKATLLRTIDGSAVIQRPIVFTVAGPDGVPGPAVTQLTDVNGVATAQVQLAKAGTNTITATFTAIANEFLQSSSASTSVVVKANSSLGTITVGSNPNPSLGFPATVSVPLLAQPSGNPAPPGNVVTFTITAPDTTVITVTGTTDSTGLAAAQFTPALLGSYGVSASFAGNANLNAAPLPATTTIPTVYQRTQLTLGAATGTAAGAPLTLSATLMAIPEGTPLTGRTVTFSFAGAIPPLTGITDTNGVATVMATFPTTGTVSLTAAYAPAATETNRNGAATAETDSGTTTISVAATALSNLVLPATTTVGTPLTASATLTRVTAPAGPISGATVTFKLTAPGGAVTNVAGTTDATGLASATFAAFTGSGLASVSASYAGTPSITASTSNTAAVTVYQRALLTLPPITANALTTTTVSATLTAQPSGTPVSGQLVTFNFTGGIAAQSATTNAAGVAAIVVTFPSPGAFSISASFSNAAAFFADHTGAFPIVAEVATSSATIGVVTTTLAPVNLPAVTLVGNALTVSTTLTRVTAPAGPLAAQTVAFALTSASGATTTQTVVTDLSGAASTTFPLTERGVNTVVASFAGTAALTPAVSSENGVTYQATTLLANAATGTVGAGVAVSARLVAVPQSVPIAGQAVTFTFAGGVSAPQTAVTDGNGVATVTAVFPLAGSVTATASFTNLANYFVDPNGNAIPDVANAAVIVLPGAPMVVWPTPGPITYGTPLSAAQLNATAVVPGIFTYTPPLGTMLTVGSQPLSVTFAPTDSGDYTTASAAVTLTVNPAVPLLTVTGATPMYDAAAHAATGSAIGVDGSTPVAGSFAFTYTPGGTAAPVSAGTYGVTGIFTSTDPNYAPTTAVGAWTSAAPLPTPRVGAVGGVLNGQLYVVGGCTPIPGDCTQLTDAEAYDATAQTWTPVANALTPRSYAGAAAIGAQLFVVGGCVTGDCSTVTNALEMYDATSQAWTQLTGMPTPRAQAAVASVNGVLYVAGGVACATCPPLTTVERFDPSTGMWTTVATLPAGQAGAAGVTIGSTVYTIGGAAGALYVYDSTMDLWTSGASMRTARTGAAAGVIAGRIYVAGGGSLTAPFLPTTEIYDPVANAWMPDTGMPTARAFAAGGVINSALYVTGGQNASGAVPTVETFTTQAATITITDATPVITWPTPGSITYGTPLSGAQLNATASVAGTFSYSPSVGAVLPAGPQTLSVTFTPTDATDFASATASVTLTVAPASASVTPDPLSKIYGSADPTLTGTLSGFLPGDNVTATYNRAAGETVAGGPYGISATLSPSSVLTNYVITSNTATFTITAAAATVTPNAASKTYGGADPTLTGTLSGFLPGDNVTATYSRVAGETVTGGPYAIGATLGPASVLSNYTITYNTVAFTINAAAATVTPNAASKIYGAADPAFTGTLAGFVAGDNVTATYARTAGQTVTGGPYTIGATLSPASVLSNYAITYNTAAFTINAAASSVTPAPANKTYGTADPALTGTLSGFLAADNVTAAYARTAGETVGGGPYPISATLSPASVLSNYTITYNTAAFTIGQAVASVTPAAASKTYGAADPSLTGALSGFLASDNVTAAYTRVAGETVPGGPYPISATLSPASALGNYAITYNTAPFTIALASSVATVTCPTSVTFTGAAQTCTAAVSGVGGLSQSLAVTYTNNLNAGTATATASYGGDANHVASTASATFTITPAPSATAVTCPASATFSGTPLTPCSAAVTGVGGLSQSLTVTYTGDTNAGTATATASYPGDANHGASSGSATFSVAKATSTAVVTCPVTTTYNGSAQAPCSAVVTGVNGLDQSLTVAYTGNTNAGTATANASYIGDANDMSSTGTAIFAIAKAASVTVVTCPASTIYSGAAQTPCTAIVTGAGGLTQSLTVSYTNNTKAGTATASASYGGDVNHNGSANSATFAIAKATPTIAWTTPAAINQGTALSAPQLNATASVPGAFVYAPASGTVLGAGQQTLSVTFTPTDAADYTTATASVTINVNVTGNLTITAGQTVTFSAGSLAHDVTVNGGNLILTNGTHVGGNVQMFGGSVTVSSSTVSGNLQGFGGSMTITNSTITGNVQANPGSVTISNSTVSGDMQLLGGGPFAIGPGTVIKGNLQIQSMPASSTVSTMCGAVVSNNLQIQSDAAPMNIGLSSGCAGNTIQGNLQIENNVAPVKVFGNTVSHNLQCSGNTAITGGGNTATQKQGQCSAF